MVRLGILIGGGVLFAHAVWGGPIEGVKRYDDGVVVEKGSPGKGKVGPIKFRGGERATVIAKGDKKPNVDLGIEVYDDKDRLVVQSLTPGDYASVVWYPPRDGSYTILLLNPSPDFNRIYLVIKQRAMPSLFESKPLRRALARWRTRHLHPVNFALHLVGIPLTVVGVVLLFVLPWTWGAAAFVVGYLLQGVGHFIEGSEMGEWAAIKKVCGARL